MINIPDKYREEFDRSADFAVNTGKFTVKELAEHLGVGELVASIMVGYMEKTGLVTKGKAEDVRRARIDCEGWERIGKKIENYIPLPEEEPKAQPEEQAEERALPEVERQSFCKKEIYVTDEGIVLVEKEETKIKYEDIAQVFVIKPAFLKKGAVVFSCDKEVPQKKGLKERSDSFVFSKGDYERAEKTAQIIANWLGVKVTFV